MVINNVVIVSDENEVIVSDENVVTMNHTI